MLHLLPLVELVSTVVIYDTDSFEETSVTVCEAGSGKINPTLLKLREEMSLHCLCFSREVEQCWQRLTVLCESKDLKMCKLLAMEQHQLPCDKAMSLALSSEHQREE